MKERMKALVLHAEITAQGTHPARSLVDSLEKTWESRVEALEVKPLVGLAAASQKDPTLVGILVLHTGAVLDPLTRVDDATKMKYRVEALEVAEEVANAYDALELEVKVAVEVAAAYELEVTLKAKPSSVVAADVQNQESD